jgi:hypothetical protein
MTKETLNQIFDGIWQEVQAAYIEHLKIYPMKHKNPTATHDEFVECYRIGMSVEEIVGAILHRQFEIGESKASYYAYKNIPLWGDEVQTSRQKGKSKWGYNVVVAKNLSLSDARKLESTLQTIWDHENPDKTRWTCVLFGLKREEIPEIKERMFWFNTIEIREMLEAGKPEKKSETEEPGQLNVDESGQFTFIDELVELAN